jgi:hypothetical protein
VGGWVFKTPIAFDTLLAPLGSNLTHAIVDQVLGVSIATFKVGYLPGYQH